MTGQVESKRRIALLAVESGFGTNFARHRVRPDPLSAVLLCCHGPVRGHHDCRPATRAPRRAPTVHTVSGHQLFLPPATRCRQVLEHLPPHVQISIYRFLVESALLFVFVRVIVSQPESYRLSMSLSLVCFD